MKGKAQSAMEFLMTYGWAILVMIIVIAVLFYIGVMNPESNTTSNCMLPAGFSCSSFKLIGHNDGFGGFLDLEIGQAMGKTIIITGVECSQRGEPLWLGSGVYPGITEGSINPPPGPGPIFILLSGQSEEAPLDDGLAFAGTPSPTIPPQPPPTFCDSPGGYECKNWANVTSLPGESRKIVGTGSRNPYFMCTDTTGVPSEDFNKGDPTKYGQLYRGKIWIQYIELETRLIRTLVGELTGRFEQ